MIACDSPDSVRTLLGACVRDGKRAVLRIPFNPPGFLAVFDHVDTHHLVVKLRDPEGFESRLDDSRTVLVTFKRDNRFMCFVTHARPAKHDKAVLSIPPDIMALGRRRSLRIPVSANGLRATVVHNGSLSYGCATDISPEGIGVAIEEGQHIPSQGSAAMVNLENAEGSFTILGTVANVTGHRCGVAAMSAFANSKVMGSLFERQFRGWFTTSRIEGQEADD